MLKNCLMILCLTGLLTGCAEPVPQIEPAFKDVARSPDITNPETPVWIVKNDRPFAEWVEEMAQACDEYGCK